MDKMSPTFDSGETADPHFPIIDSHLHLFPESELHSLAWHTPDGPLADQYSVVEYLQAIEQAPFPRNGTFTGFIFIEADRKSHVSESLGGWENPLQELAFIGRVAEGKPSAGEGHQPEDAKWCKGIVGWAPVPAGRERMQDYIHRAKRECGGMMSKFAGVRYLVQDKPAGTMLTPSFIESLMYLGENGYTFDLGVDYCSGGVGQLKEAVEMVSRAIDGVAPNERVSIVINHMCKPDMLLPTSEAASHQRFHEWSEQIEALAAFPNTYMKISGAFSEMQPLPDQYEQESMGFRQRTNMLTSVTTHASLWLQVVLSAFSSRRLMFGSDWPVCNIGGGGNASAFKNWASIVRDFTASLDEESQARIWGLNATEVYISSRRKGRPVT